MPARDRMGDNRAPMSSPPPSRGQIPEGGAIDLLRELETNRVTGVLRYESDGKSGEILLFGGEIAVDQKPRSDGDDPVDAFLSAGELRYEIRQELPELPVSRGDGRTKQGSLAVHVPADLMNWCEHAGLTGVLELTHEGRRAEAFYERGELLAIELDGSDAADLHEVFGWEQGRFRVRLDEEAIARFHRDHAEPPEAEAWAPAPPAKREDTRQFLRVVEMALAEVVDTSEKARSPTRTSPPLPPPPKKRPRPDSMPPPRTRRRDEQTVRLIYLSGDPPPPQEEDASTRHVRGDVTAEFALTEAQPERRARIEESPPMAKKKKKTPKKPQPAPEPEAPQEERVTEASEAEEAAAPEPTPKKKSAEPAPPETPSPPPGGLAGAAGWTLGTVALGVAILALLALLPPVSCPPGREVCGWSSGCVDLSSDAENCGACGQSCGAGTCQFGECTE